MTGDPQPRGWHRTLLVGTVGLVSLAAWVALWHFGPAFHSPAHPHQADAGSALGIGLLFVTSWTLMTMAMMLPTTIPLVATFHTIAGQRSDRAVLVALVVAGYLLIWAVIGVLFYTAAALVQSVAWWRAHASLGGAAMLVVAGGYQFTSLKHRCLDKCRSPLSFVLAHWQGQSHRRNAIRLGVHHGLFCVGCCWALMLLMFAVGMGNLGWMLVLGAVMAVEKNVAWGRTLSAPLGAALLAGGLTLLGGA